MSLNLTFTSRPTAILILAAFGTTLLGQPTLARAAAPDAKPDSKEVCASAYENVQRLRQGGQLRAAKAQLPTCEAETCPSFMRDDCTKWDGEITDAMPTIVVAAKDENGHDTTAVRVIVDDIVVADQADGKPIPVDPGQHRIRYESGTRATQDTFVVRQGEKNHPLSTSFAPPPPPPAPPESHRKIPTVSWILGGVAAAGVVSFTAFAIAGKSAEGCAPTCSRSNVDSLRRDYLIADISLGVGVVAAAAAVYFALTAKPAITSAPRAATISIEPDLTVHGADVSVRAAF